MPNFLLSEPVSVFICLPKTAGSSMRKYFGLTGPNVNMALGEIPDSWFSAWKFTFVRNPYDRLISAWMMFGQDPARGRLFTLSDFLDVAQCETVRFDRVGPTATQLEKIRHHCLPQTHPFHCWQHADFIGRFERLEEDFQKLLDAFGEVGSLPHVMATVHRPYQEYYNADLRARVALWYRKDLDALGYSFEPT